MTDRALRFNSLCQPQPSKCKCPMRRRDVGYDRSHQKNHDSHASVALGYTFSVANTGVAYRL